MEFYSNDAERSVIGGLLLDNNAIDKCQNLTAAMFGNQAHSMIFAAISDLVTKGVSADVVTVNNALQVRGEDEAVGGLTYLVELATNTPSAANIKRYASIVKDKHIESEIFRAGRQLQEIALSRGGEAIADKQQKVAQVFGELESDGQGDKDVSDARQAIKDAILHLDTVMNLPTGELLGFGCGLKAIDQATYGFGRGELMIVAGRPSMGKSVFAENLMRFNAKKGFKVRYQSYEMKARDLAMRSVSAEGEIDFGSLRKGLMTADEWSNLSVASAKYAELPITIDEDQLHINQIISRCRAQKRKSGLDILVVDHLHLMPFSEKDEVKALGQITKYLKLIAKELDILVCLVAQLNRSVEQRTDKKPMMADLRGSGSIEQDADYILFPWRPAYYFTDRNPYEAFIFIAKNRNGETFAESGLPVGWQGKYQKFTNDIDGWSPPEALEQEKKEDLYSL